MNMIVGVLVEVVGIVAAAEQEASTRKSLLESLHKARQIPHYFCGKSSKIMGDFTKLYVTLYGCVYIYIYKSCLDSELGIL